MGLIWHMGCLRGMGIFWSFVVELEIITIFVFRKIKEFMVKKIYHKSKILQTKMRWRLHGWNQKEIQKKNLLLTM